MFEILENLCNTDGTSGDEAAVRDLIIKYIDGFCEWRVDALGNIIVFKKGEKRAVKKVMIDAHMDEVGLIITAVTPDGFLKFKTVGGIDTSVLLARQVKINGEVDGVICSKPIHLLGAEESKKLPKEETLYIDIGAKDRAEALENVSLGDCAIICGEYCDLDESILSKALDDRIGCAVLIDLIRNESKYDFYASFSVQEEVGLRGAKTATYAINPDSAIVLEGTTAADIADVPEDKKVCIQGEGVAVSFMDKSTVYDRVYYKKALESGIKCQSKSAVTGGNNSGAVHLNREGVRTVALSVPCRYIHSASSVAQKQDIISAKQLALFMLNGIASGEID